ncbi:MAG: TonB-system energizer ExbB [Syntrophorhabdaceae bacterium]|nr:TonB-system energizer ExbB [Syntrophorhabdaceae bacterium]
MQWLVYLVDYGIIGLLGIMSFFSVAFFVERYLFFKRLDMARYDNDRKLFEIDMTKRMSVIATIGSNAPYVGLLGTVLGIMLTFSTIGSQGYVDATGVMFGLALALKATAIGLVVAIPSIVFHNYLVRKVKVALLRWDAAYAGTTLETKGTGRQQGT